MKSVHALTFVAIFLTASVAYGSEAQLSQVVREVLEPAFRENATFKGCSVGIVYAGEDYAFGHGSTGNERYPLPDERTVYEIASISKIFTGTLLAEMVLNNEVSAEEHVYDIFFKDKASLAENDPKRAITLRQLAQHRSGLPRLVPDFWSVAEKTPENPYSSFQRNDIENAFLRCELLTSPGEKYEYSNFGYAMLGAALAQRKGIPFETLLNERVLLPLHMRDTGVELSEEMRNRLAPGHDRDGKPCGNWDLGVFVPGGGLRSNVKDMLRFVHAAMDSNPQKTGDDSQTPLHQAFALAMQAETEGPPNAKIGFGWNYSPERNFYWHNGQTGGYYAMFLVDPKRRQAVVLLANTSDPTFDALAVKIFEQL